MSYRTATWRPALDGVSAPPALVWPTRHMGDITNHALDMTAWVLDANDQISNAVAIPVPADLLCSTPSVSGACVFLKIAGGSAQTYVVTITMTLASGATRQEVISLQTIVSNISGLNLPRSPVLLSVDAYWSNGTQVLSAPNWLALPTSNFWLVSNQWWNNSTVVMLTTNSNILPTSSTGLPPGQIWNNGGVVTFAAGSPGVPTSSAGLPSGSRWSNGGVLSIVT